MIKLLLFSLVFINLWATPLKADVIDKVYATLQADYINNLTCRDISLRGLRALEKSDKDLKISATDDKLYIYYKRQLKAIFDLPTEEDKAKWAKLSRDAIAKAVKISPAIELYDYEMSDRFAKEVFNGLDGYSHYFGGFDNEAEAGDVRRNFASRQVGDNILLIKVVSFQKGVTEQVWEEVKNCTDCEGFILDLRGNHGGLLDEALRITDIFLDEGIITYTAGGKGQSPNFYTASAGDDANNKPLVILVDGFTASASEVLAAALSEQNRAVLVGTETYGKGTIQEVVNMGRDRAMSYTTSYFYTPSGQKIDKEGLNPAICSGGLQTVKNWKDKLMDGKCDREDRFNEEVDVLIAKSYIKNEL